MKKFILSVLLFFAVLIPAYAQVNKVDQLAHAIARAEGFYVPGSCPNRFHNPGDLTSSRLHIYPGQIGLSPHRYVIFKNATYGWSALRGQIQKIIDGTSVHYTQEMTFAQIRYIYAADKNCGNVCRILRISPQTTFAEFFNLPPKVHYVFNIQEILRTLSQSQGRDRDVAHRPAQQLLASYGCDLRDHRKGLVNEWNTNEWLVRL